MSRFLKILGYVAGGLVLVVGVAALVVYTSSNARLKKTFVVKPRPVAIPTDAASIARGKHLAHTRGCSDCHAQDFAGAKIIDDGPMGFVAGPNLTRGKGGRIDRFTDEDWVRAIRHGVGPDTVGLFIMPSNEYAHLSDPDLGALIAFLKSTPPVDRVREPTSLGPVARVLVATGKMKLAAESIDHANIQPPTVTPGVTPEYGRYIAVTCMGCHSSNFSGGKIEIGPPSWPEAANLTPHTDSRMSKWTEAEFIAVLRTAKRPDGTELNAVMPRAFGQMEDVELKALWAYFKSLPPTPKGTR